MATTRKTTDTHVSVALGPVAGIWTTASHFQRPSVPATGPRERPPVVSTTRGTSSPETCLAHLPIGTDAAPPALSTRKVRTSRPGFLRSRASRARERQRPWAHSQRTARTGGGPAQHHTLDAVTRRSALRGAHPCRPPANPPRGGLGRHTGASDVHAHTPARPRSSSTSV